MVRRRCPTALVRRSLFREWPHEAVTHACETDLLILGGPRRGTRTGLGPGRGTRTGLGPTAQAAVVHAPGSVLLVPRSG
jgi:nucleotide-binding universal stress UspA family protein